MIWNRFKWLWKSYWELRRKTHVLAMYGTRLIATSVLAFSGIKFGIKFILEEDNIIKEIVLSDGDLSLISYIIICLTFILGCILVFLDIFKLYSQARHTAKVLITGMAGTSVRFPAELLSYTELYDSREVIELSLPESKDHIIENLVKIYNAELVVRIYERFILHDNCNKVFLGGLARIPFLVAYGANFRAISAEIKYFDRFHRDGKWQFLNEEDEDIFISDVNLESINIDSKGNIGLALEFSTQISKYQLPKYLQEHTMILKPNIETGRNLIKNQDNLNRISKQVQKIIDAFSAVQNCNTIHLFLSVQSTLALDIGKRYQEGIHKNWVIHNYDASTGKYNWGLELSKQGCKIYHEDY